jgi:hypothetical protein
MTRSTTCRKKRWRSSQGGDNLDMVGHSGMEGSRCNVIMKKNASAQFELLQLTNSIYTLWWQLIFFYRWIENGCTSVIKWANILAKYWKLFLEITVKYKKPKNMSDVHYICCSCVDCCNEKKDLRYRGDSWALAC